MLTREKFEAEARAKFNEICIVHDHMMARLVGIHIDALDYYYIVHSMRGFGNRGKELPDGGREILASAAGACSTLKGHERYDSLETTFMLNGSPRAKEFIVRIDDRTIEELYPQEE
jgi:hypothetical protein